MSRTEQNRNRYVEDDVAGGRYSVPKSEFYALDNRRKADFLGLLWNHETASAAWLQTLGIHPLQRLLDLESEAINPTVSFVRALEPTQVSTHFDGVG